MAGASGYLTLVLFEGMRVVLGVTCFPYQADVLPFFQAEILPFVHDLNSILLAKNKTKKSIQS